MRLTNQQKDALVGTLLGDACLEKNGYKVRLRIDHSGKQKEYVFWKHDIFSNLTLSKPRSLRVRDRRTKKVYSHWRFDTISCDQFVDFKQIFYSINRKVIPSNIEQLLKSKLSLAVWYMDDGYNRKDCRGMHLNTQAYSVEEHKRLQGCLRRNYGVNTRLHQQRNKFKLYIPSEQRAKFVELIRPYVIPSMVYKLL